MKRLHLVMLLVALVFAGIVLGFLFGGGRGAHAGAAVGVALVGVTLWTIAPVECRRQLRIIERRGTVLPDPETFRARFLRGARLPAAVLILLGLAALVVILLIPY